MKIKSIGEICKKKKTLHLYTQEGEYSITQYIGDGCAAYLLENMPELDAASAMTIFDVPEKQKEDWYIKEKGIPEGVNFQDKDFSEKVLEPQGIEIIHTGKRLMAFRGSKGTLFVDKKYMAPMTDSRENLEFYERVTGDGRRYIAAKVGFFLLAVIFPVILKGKSLDVLRATAEGAVMQAQYEKLREAARERNMRINPETGEAAAEEE